MREIWYVENDEDDLFLIERAFRKIGLDKAIRHYRSGDEFKRALQGDEAEKSPPKLFLFDLKLDGESGLDLLRWVKSHPESANQPAYILSSGNMPQELIRSMELEAKAYIFKPLTADEWRNIAENLAQSAGLEAKP
jgi:DNA-binding response OmpR family regulator